LEFEIFAEQEMIDSEFWYAKNLVIAINVGLPLRTIRLILKSLATQDKPGMNSGHGLC
jgi:hypothetical protein